MEINETSGQYSRKNVVGEVIYNQSKYKEPCTKEFDRIDGLVVYLKAVRRVGGYLGLYIGEKEIRALAMIWKWSQLNKRDGGPRSTIVDWSGYKKSWKGRMQAGIERCLELELLENKLVMGGQRLCITEKGLNVFRALNTQSEIVIEEFEGKREKPKRDRL